MPFPSEGKAATLTNNPSVKDNPEKRGGTGSGTLRRRYYNPPLTQNGNRKAKVYTEAS